MISSLIGSLTCDICGAGMLLDYEGTISMFSRELIVTDENVLSVVEEMTPQMLLYKCSSCFVSYKATFKEIEALVRKKFTEKVLILYGRKAITSVSNIHNKYLVFCNKCNGYDGRGCCPKEIFDDCKIKRFPTNGI